jgi:hypothetical protein
MMELESIADLLRYAVDVGCVWNDKLVRTTLTSDLSTFSILGMKAIIKGLSKNHLILMWAMLHLNEILGNVGMVLYRAMLKSDAGNLGHGCHTHIYMHDVCIFTCLL